MTGAAAAPVLADVGGLPFLDASFRWRRLLAITAAVRISAARQRDLPGSAGADDAEAWLAPGRALLLRSAQVAMPALPLTDGQLARVRDAAALIGERVSWWAPLALLPVEYVLLHPAKGAISASSRNWPQHVLLAPEAFASGAELLEQSLHELSHQWLYLIEGIWPLELPAAPPVTLPSGTPGRSPAEVLGAAHVAAVLIRLYQAGHGTSQRRAQLAGYGTACLELACGTASLTETGQAVAQRLKEEF